MASSVPIMPFLRPLPLPRPATVQRFLRFSTSSACRAEAQASRAQEDPNLLASLTTSPTYPPASLKSPPRPKESRASHRTKHPRPLRTYPTRHPSHTTPAHRPMIPGPVDFLPEHQCAPNLPYYVSRTKSNELPIYHDWKRGGNLKLTTIRKIDGRPETLRDDLMGLLGLPREDAVVNGVTGHVVLKGHHKVEVEKFLRQRRF